MKTQCRIEENKPSPCLSCRNLKERLHRAHRVETIGEMAGGVAHEINNPLAVILMFAQGVLRQMPEDHPLRLPLVSIEREAQRCKRLAGNLLSYSRSSTGKVEMLDLNTLLEEALTLVRCKARLASVQIRCEPGSGLPLLRGDHTRLAQVLVNIALNAVDAMPDGGELRISTGNRQKEVWVKLQDNGPGLSKEMQERIFESFFTTKAPGKGTGLGLSLAHETVRLHGGTIEIESAPGHGATFTVRLPAASQEARHRRPVRVPQPVAESHG